MLLHDIHTWSTDELVNFRDDLNDCIVRLIGGGEMYLSPRCQRLRDVAADVNGEIGRRQGEALWDAIVTIAESEEDETRPRGLIQGRVSGRST